MEKAALMFHSVLGPIIGIHGKSLCFNVSQRDEVILSEFKRYLRCGTMRRRNDGVWYYEVNNLVAIVENVIPFFDHFGFMSAKKQRDFAKFKLLARILVERRQGGREGITEILQIRSDMNDGGKRRYTDDLILAAFENPQRLYAGHDKPSRDEIVRSPWRHGELGRNDRAPERPFGSNNHERS